MFVCSVMMGVAMPFKNDPSSVRLTSDDGWILEEADKREVDPSRPIQLDGCQLRQRVPVERCFLQKSLNGGIPTSIGTLSSLRLLNLSSNQLEGPIPVSLGDISTLEQMDLGKNKLSGHIPKELSKLYGLEVFDVSSNNLCGPIPRGTQFSTFSTSSFQKNKCLYGCPLDSCNEKERPVIQGDNNSHNYNVKVGWLNHVDEKISLIALGIGVGIGIWVVVGIFIVWERATRWVLALPPNKPQPFYGEYRFPM